MDNFKANIDIAVMAVLTSLLEYSESVEYLSVKKETPKGVNPDSKGAKLITRIDTNYGTAFVFPNMETGVPAAAFFNQATFEYMKKEGFEIDFILGDGKLFSSLTEDMQIVGAYLSQKIELDKR